MADDWLRTSCVFTFGYATFIIYDIYDYDYDTILFKSFIVRSSYKFVTHN